MLKFAETRLGNAAWHYNTPEEWRAKNDDVGAPGGNAERNSLMRKGPFSNVKTPTDPAVDSILIIGNAPSTKAIADYGFEKLSARLHTFGMGAAYRYFRERNWWPTYYAWCAAESVYSHKRALRELIEAPNIQTQRFFFSLPISDNKRFELVDHCATVDFCLRKSLEIGYKNVFLIGTETSRVHETPESRALTEEEFQALGYGDLFRMLASADDEKTEPIRLSRDDLRVIARSPIEHPDYFFDTYERYGDVYSLSLSHEDNCLKSKQLKGSSDALVKCLSNNSSLEGIEQCTIDSFLSSFPPDIDTETIFAPFGRAIEYPQYLARSDREALRDHAGVNSDTPLATLILGVRLPNNDASRAENFLFMLDWIDLHYGDLFDVLVVEQDTHSKLTTIARKFKPYVRHKFIYNPHDYNRGWGFNTAVKHFTHTPIVVLLDTDVLPGRNFAHEIVAAHTTYKAISPYKNIYYSNEEEARMIKATFDFPDVFSIDHLAKPNTFAGGIVIIRRDVFLEISGFEQYIEYAGEDRSLDVKLLNHCTLEEMRSAPFTYIHLHHPPNTDARPRAKELLAHLRENFGCCHDPKLQPYQYIHDACQHVSGEYSQSDTKNRQASFGDVDLYRSGRVLTIDGCYAEREPSDRERVGGIDA